MTKNLITGDGNRSGSVSNSIWKQIASPTMFSVSKPDRTEEIFLFPDPESVSFFCFLFLFPHVIPPLSNQKQKQYIRGDRRSPPRDFFYKKISQQIKQSKKGIQKNLYITHSLPFSISNPSLNHPFTTTHKPHR